MPDQPKTPLKVGQSGCNFHRKLSLYQRMILHRAGPLEGYFRNSISGVLGAPHTTPQVEDVRYVIILLT